MNVKEILQNSLKGILDQLELQKQYAQEYEQLVKQEGDIATRKAQLVALYNAIDTSKLQTEANDIQAALSELAEMDKAPEDSTEA